MEGAHQDHLTLRDYAAPVLSRAWLVVAIVVAITGGAYYYYSQKDQIYKASTKLYVAQESDPLVGVGAGFSDDRTVENQATLLTSLDVAKVVARKIRYAGSPAALVGQVTATPSAGADFITIAASGSS